MQAATPYDTYKPHKRFLQVGFNYGHFNPKDCPSLKSDVGASLAYFRSYWGRGSRYKRFRLGADVGWLDANWYKYKVNMSTFDGPTVSYDFQQIDLGVQAGIGAEFSITKDVCLHARACYNPAFSFDYIQDDFNIALAHYGAVGVNVSWKHVGIGLDAKFGKAKYTNADFEDGDESYDDDMIIPGSSNGSEKFRVKLNTLRASIVFSF